MFFTTVNPMDDDFGMGANSTRSDETKDRAIQEYLETSPEYSKLVRVENSLKRKDCCFTKQGRMQSFYDTLPAVCIEKVVCMKTKDELFQKVRLTPRVPRAVLKSNSQIGKNIL